MILCVTLNPCLDKTLTVPRWAPGDSVRGRSVREVVGGKGNNVARALSRLGHADARPATVLGGPIGAHCEALLRREFADPLLVGVEAPTREILTVHTEGSADQTAFFDPDPAFSDAEAERFRASIEAELSRGHVRALTLSGSSPAPATHGLYGLLIASAKARGIPTFLDTYGPSLAAIADAWPDVLQVNAREAALYLGSSAAPGEAELLRLLEQWSHRGVRLAVITAGPDRVLARIEGASYRATPPAIEPVNPIGSGDSFLAGLVDSRLRGLDPIATLKHAVGCAMANALVWDAGAIDPREAERAASGVVVVPVASVS